MIEYVTGNVLDTIDMHIVQGCNAQGVMGSGVAKAIRDLHPKVYDEYKRWEADFGLSLGDVIAVETDYNVFLNGITQEFYGRDGKQYVDYDAIRKVMRQVRGYVLADPVSMPKIGAGLGGGDWDIIEKIINEELEDVRVTVYVYEGS